MTVLELSSENFEKEVINSEIPVLVDFFASWCGPCQMLAPIFENLSSEYAGKLKFAKLSTEDEPEIAQKYGVQSIPNLKLFWNGTVVDEIVGFGPKHVMKLKIDSLIASLSK